MVTNYTTKSYIKSGMRFRSRKLLVLYIKSHIYTKFNTPKIFLIRCTWLYLFPLSPILRKFVVSKNTLKSGAKRPL